MLSRRLCCCDRRVLAQTEGEMFYAPHKEAWVFVLDRLRSMSSKARYYAMIDRSEFPHVDHTGEPFYHHSCPFCGEDLPYTPPTYVTLNVSQADGEDGG